MPRPSLFPCLPRWRCLGLLGGLFALSVGCPPAEPPPARHPHTLPPQPPSTAPACQDGEVLQGGRWRWTRGQWAWEAPRCIPRPAEFHSGCVWSRGLWHKRADGRLEHTPGRFRCPPRSSPRPR